MKPNPIGPRASRRAGSRGLWLSLALALLVGFRSLEAARSDDTHVQYLPLLMRPPWVSASSLGVHALNNSDPDVWNFVRQTHPRVVKSVDNLGWLAEAKAESPLTLTIGRLSGQNEAWADSLDPVAAAHLYVDEKIGTYQLNPGVDYWEGWNEYQPGTGNLEHWNWYAQFEAERACEMQRRGLRAAVGGFSTGVPEYADMALFLPALEAAHECGAIFTLHEYNAPTLQCGVEVGYRLPGAEDLVTDKPMGYLTLRYRFWYEGYLKPAGLGDLPLVISELGVQGPSTTCGDTGTTEQGWRNYREWWVGQGWTTDGNQFYVDLLAWYDSEIRQDDYVLGATIFTGGAVNEGEWSTFDIHDILIPLLADYVAGVP